MENTEKSNLAGGLCKNNDARPDNFLADNLKSTPFTRIYLQQLKAIPFCENE